MLQLLPLYKVYLLPYDNKKKRIEGKKTFFRGFMKGKPGVVIDAKTMINGKDALQKLGITNQNGDGRL